MCCIKSLQNEDKETTNRAFGEEDEAFEES